MFSGLILAHPRLVGITLRAEAPQSFEVPLRSLGRRRESLRPGQRRPSGNRNTGGRRSVGTRNHTPVDVGTLPDICFAWFGTALSSIPVRNLRCPSGSSKYYGFCCCSEAPPSFEVSLRNLGCRRESIRPSLPWPFQLRPLRLKLFLFELVLRSNKQVLAVVTPCLPVPKMQCSGPNSH